VDADEIKRLRDKIDSGKPFTLDEQMQLLNEVALLRGLACHLCGKPRLREPEEHEGVICETCWGRRAEKLEQERDTARAELARDCSEVCGVKCGFCHSCLKTQLEFARTALAKVVEFDCGDDVRLVHGYDGVLERKGWWFSYHSWKSKPEDVEALWALPAWDTAEEAFVALSEWRSRRGS
jgi:hypothetical protein